MAPGNLVEPWHDELKDKFALEFELLSSEQIETSVTGKPFVERNPLIVRLDMASRSETLQAKLIGGRGLGPRHRRRGAPRGRFDSEVKYTKRYKFGSSSGAARDTFC